MLSLKMFCSLMLVVCFLLGKCMSQVPAGHIKPSILHELKDFRNLIPKSVIDEIAAKHLIIDSEFRHAFEFMTSSELPQLVQRIQQIPEVIDIFEFLNIWESTNNDVFDAQTKSPHFLENPLYDNNHNFIDYVLINANDESVISTIPMTEAPQTSYAVQNVRDFVLEVLAHLNRHNFASMISEKRGSSPDFNTMYKALRSAVFRLKVDAALKTKNLMSIVQLLQQHGINVNVLEPIAFEVLSWGPPAIRKKRRKHKFTTYNA